ncbi:MAG: hypothetical protein MZV64_19605 [Ignavibacteriales bacterium]|nr:hypothetical protein [Ignavibacteriales bacterium]
MPALPHPPLPLTRSCVSPSRNLPVFFREILPPSFYGTRRSMSCACTRARSSV